MFLSVGGGRFWICSSGTSHWVRRRRFLTLMVSAPGSSAPAPPRGPSSTFLTVDGGCFRIFSSDTYKRVRRQCFLTLMVDATRSPASAPRRGGHRRRFLALIVDAPGSSAQSWTGLSLRGTPHVVSSRRPRVCRSATEVARLVRVHRRDVAHASP
jgi:hypothetical protein